MNGKTPASGAKSLHLGILALNPIVERGLISMLNDDPGFEARSLIAELPAIDLELPDVIVAYVEDSIENVTQNIDPEELTPLVLLMELIDSATPEFGPRPIALLSANAEPDTLALAIRGVDHGLTLADAEMAHTLQTHIGQRIPNESLAIDQISPREVQVLELVANGLPNKAIAVALGISEHTVKFHVGSILDKLNANSRTEAVMIATRQGILRI